MSEVFNSFMTSVTDLMETTTAQVHIISIGIVARGEIA